MESTIIFLVVTIGAFKVAENSLFYLETMYFWVPKISMV